jgi:para-nitrobenzyl esterase
MPNATVIILITLNVLCLSILVHINGDVSVKTNCGTVNGAIKDGAYSFRGIPYATPPVGKLRWKPSEALSPEAGNCWNGTFNAHAYGNTCFQISPEDPERKTLIGSEDCLYLNVMTPDLKPDKLKPVMVWIHGGSLQVSNGNWPLYMPTEKLAVETDIVYVGFNYRLHAFGFMALQMLADNSSSGTSGNYGFMDMITVLQWVQQNIRNFGGDSNQVSY